MGGSGSGRPRETTGELDGCNKDLASVFSFFFFFCTKVSNLASAEGFWSAKAEPSPFKAL